MKISLDSQELQVYMNHLMWVVLLSLLQKIQKLQKGDNFSPIHSPTPFLHWSHNFLSFFYAGPYLIALQ